MKEYDIGYPHSQSPRPIKKGSRVNIEIKLSPGSRGKSFMMALGPAGTGVFHTMDVGVRSFQRSLKNTVWIIILPFWRWDPKKDSFCMI